MECFILIDGTPERLGAFANRGPEQAALVDNLLNDADLTRQVLLACGAKGGDYGKAMTIYQDIQKKSSDFDGNAVLQRARYSVPPSNMLLLWLNLIHPPFLSIQWNAICTMNKHI
jgi:hypothetical protein